MHTAKIHVVPSLPLHAVSIFARNKNKEGFEKIVDYKHNELQRMLAQHCLYVLNKKPVSCANDSLSSTPVVGSCSPSASISATVPFGSPNFPLNYEQDFYNGTRQQGWARELLVGLFNFVNNATSLVQGSAVSAFYALLPKISTLLGKYPNLVESDFDELCELPKEVSDTVLGANISEALKSELANNLCEVFGTKDTLTQVFADARIEGFFDILNAAKSKVSEEEFQTVFGAVNTKILQLKEYNSTFTDQDIAYILSVGEELSQAIIASSMEREDKIRLSELLNWVYQQQTKILRTYNTVLEATGFVNRYQESLFRDVVHMVTSIARVFAPIDLNALSGNLNSATIVGALQAARALYARFPDLNRREKQLVNTVCEQYKVFAPYLAAIWAYSIASSELSLKPFATSQDIATAITTAADAITNVNFSFVDQEFPKVMKQITSNGQVTIGNATYTIYSVDSATNKVSVNLSLLDTGSPLLTAVQAEAEKSSDTLARAYFAFKADSAIEFAKLDDVVEVFQDNLAQFKQWTTNFHMDQLLMQSQGLQAMALPSSVATVLVERFMPQEVDFLVQTKDLLYYSNLGSSVGTTIIGAISQYVNGATYFNFASYVGQESAVGLSQSQTTHFSGSAESATKKLNSERAQAASYLINTKNALQVIAEQEARVNADKVISNEQRTRILDKLQKYSDNLHSIESSLVLLLNFLAPLKVAEVPNLPGTFTVTGVWDQWQDRLSLVEDQLVSGSVGDAVQGGLFPLQALVQSDQQAFADMGQNYQLELQMRLTSMQQEWTVVATSLQLLNQIYLNLSRSLMK